MAQLIDTYNRTIDYLRISVTDRCNLRCTYCMPSEGIQLAQPSEILRYEELLRIATVAVTTVAVLVSPSALLTATVTLAGVGQFDLPVSQRLTIGPDRMLRTRVVGVPTTRAGSALAATTTVTGPLLGGAVRPFPGVGLR